MGKGPGRVAGKPFSQLNISRPFRRLSPRRDSHWTTAALYSRFGSHVIFYTSSKSKRSASMVALARMES
jgi:hypothetical protein